MSLFCLSLWLCWTCREAQAPCYTSQRSSQEDLDLAFSGCQGERNGAYPGCDSELGGFPGAMIKACQEALVKRRTRMMGHGQQSCMSPRDCRNVPWCWDRCFSATSLSPWNHNGPHKRSHRLSPSTYLVNTRALYRNTRLCTLLEWVDLVSLCIFQSLPHTLKQCVSLDPLIWHTSYK